VNVIQDQQSEFNTSLKSEMGELRKVISSVQCLINDHEKTIALINNSIASILARFDSLVDENKKLLKRIDNLEVQLNFAEQESLRNVLEIHSIPTENWGSAGSPCVSSGKFPWDKN
jgi:chromosome segregation ATPase